MKRVIALLLIVYAGGCLPALSKDIDSLLYKLPLAQDTARIHLLNRLGQAYQYQDLKKSKAYLDSAYREATALDYTPGKGWACLHLGIAAMLGGNMIKAKQYVSEAHQLFVELKESRGIANCQLNLGNIHYLQGQYPEAQFYYQEARSNFQALQDIRGQIKCASNLGLILMDIGAFHRALAYFFDNLLLCEQMNEHYGMANQHVYIAQVYQSLGELEQAVAYQLKALALYQNLGDRVRQAKLLSDIGKSYHQLQQYKLALDYYQQAWSMEQEHGNSSIIAIILSNIGSVHEALHQNQRAESYYKKALQMMEEQGERVALPNILYNLASINFKNDQYTIAIVYLEKSIEVAAALQNQETLQLAYYLFHQIHEAQGNYQQALANYRMAVAYQDSLFNAEKNRQVTEVKTQYEVEKKEQQIAVQEQKIALLEKNRLTERRLRLALASLAVLMLLLAVILYNRYRFKQGVAQVLQEKNIQIAAKNTQIASMNQELEKRMLRAQMDPHFIFNSLNSIQHFITINDKKSALTYLAKFSKLVRQVLENSINVQVPIADEIALLERYLELEALRFHQQFTYSIEVDEAIDIYETEIPFLLIQPYVENALVHGLRHKSQDGKLTIALKKTEGHLHCRIEDNGIGRKQALQYKANDTVPSRGMSVTQQRLEVLNYGQSQKTHIQITDLYNEQGEAAGTCVDLYIPQPEQICLMPS